MRWRRYHEAMATSNKAASDTLGVSPVFGDVAAKFQAAVRKEIERRLRLGLPVVVDRGHGVEELTADDEELQRLLQGQP